MNTHDRILWLDVMRVCACLMVMTVHATEPFYLGGEGSRIFTATDALWASFFDSFVRACVPLFVVTSSYLLFPLQTSAGAFFRRRAGRLLVPFVLWSLAYALVWGDPVTNLRSLLLNFNYAAGHLWFVYMLAGVYLLMPLLSPWAERVERRELRGYLVLWGLTLLIPFVREWASGGELLVVHGPTGILPVVGRSQLERLRDILLRQRFRGLPASGTLLPALRTRPFVASHALRGATLVAGRLCAVLLRFSHACVGQRERFPLRGSCGRSRRVGDTLVQRHPWCCLHDRRVVAAVQRQALGFPVVFCCGCCNPVVPGAGSLQDVLCVCVPAHRPFQRQLRNVPLPHVRPRLGVCRLLRMAWHGYGRMSWGVDDSRRNHLYRPHHLLRHSPRLHPPPAYSASGEMAGGVNTLLLNIRFCPLSRPRDGRSAGLRRAAGARWVRCAAPTAVRVRRR